VQVGGGALASSVIQGLTEAKALGAIDRLPRIHAVQTQNAHPLARAYDLVRARLLDRLGGSADAARDRLRVATTSGSIEQELVWVARHRSQFMWPWTPPPHSVATGILDDETYDWLAVVRGMLATGGRPVLVGESALLDANRFARTTTGIQVDTTGSAGLAGLLQLRHLGEVRSDEACAVLFTGIRRNGGTP
jgi:threonine synthase